MSNKIYGFTSLTGGGSGALDAIDGSILSAGDLAYGSDGVEHYDFVLVTTGVAESSPDTITPDNNAGNKRWSRRHDVHNHNALYSALGHNHDATYSVLAHTHASGLSVAWTSVSSFENSWANYGGGLSSAAYSKDINGFVHLKGNVKSGTLPGTVFYLPLGCRPSEIQSFSVASLEEGVGYVIGQVYVYNDGSVQALAGNNDIISLDGITFYAG